MVLVYTMKVYSLSDFLTKSQNYFFKMASDEKNTIRGEIYVMGRRYLEYTSVQIEILHTLFCNICKKLKKDSIGQGYCSNR